MRRLAGPVAVLRPLLEARALGDAVDVDGPSDAAAAVVAELPRRDVLLREFKNGLSLPHARLHAGRLCTRVEQPKAGGLVLLSTAGNAASACSTQQPC